MHIKVFLLVRQGDIAITWLKPIAKPTFFSAVTLAVCFCYYWTFCILTDLGRQSCFTFLNIWKCSRYWQLCCPCGMSLNQHSNKKIWIVMPCSQDAVPFLSYYKFLFYNAIHNFQLRKCNTRSPGEFYIRNFDLLKCDTVVWYKFYYISVKFSDYSVTSWEIVFFVITKMGSKMTVAKSNLYYVININTTVPVCTASKSCFWIHSK